MKLTKILAAAVLSVTVASSNDIMMESMATMDNGMSMIQKGFMNNNLKLVKEGMTLVNKGNNQFSNPKLIKKYLPKDKRHMVNVAENQAKRITLDLNVLEIRLDNKAYTSAATAYSDMLNACSRCHAIVRNW